LAKTQDDWADYLSKSGKVFEIRKARLARFYSNAGNKTRFPKESFTIKHTPGQAKCACIHLPERPWISSGSFCICWPCKFFVWMNGVDARAEIFNGARQNK
jgi:hypothetical protein